MNENAIRMKKEIRMIAGYRALVISKYLISIFLGLVSLYLGYIRYALSPFYVLLFLNILPPILNNALKEYVVKNNKLLKNITRDELFKLSHLKSKYKYSRLNYVTNSVSYLFTLLLICLWQYNYTNSEDIIGFLKFLPVSILGTGVLLRFLGVVFYQVKFHYDLTHNKT